MSYLSNIKLSGVTCGACEKVIKSRLKAIQGVVEVKVNIGDGQTIISSSQQITKEEIKNALAGTHYQIINN
ncbi:MAG: Copper chaperone CopZ [Candidatus Roizmanbacteria bacterium GW2011_GWA2_36_23]|uniref:Copper chaperone CopZ n=1 Tax=Candidatus Roizmanbacteria bacterium GW2011_GWA2_36_23 TaxID=1618480 RepID=A0A0G0GQ77_9BACT|nr:MAG: Copper chaperone CopZ [Candidatus Roizmanbacteria bacterium GW2011_GWA2_36_23]